MERYTLNLNEEELINYFEKYNVQELETFKTIFEYIYDYDVTNEITILNEVYENRFRKSAEEYCVPIKTTNFQATDLTKRNGELTDKEVEFLYLLTDDARLCLSSINHYDVEELYNAVDDIAETSYEEMEARKRMKGKTIKLNLKTKKEV